MSTIWNVLIFFYLIESEKIYVTYVLSSVNILTFDKGGRRFASPRPERPLKSQNWFNPTEPFCKKYVRWQYLTKKTFIPELNIQNFEIFEINPGLQAKSTSVSCNFGPKWSIIEK